MANWIFLPLIKNTDQRTLERWVGWEADPSARSSLGEAGMSLTKRDLALKKMEAETSFRKHPITGEREFLLHRTAGNSESKLVEHGGTVYNSGGKNAVRKISKSKFLNYTSWSTKIVTPNFWTNHCISAWVPESKISFVPSQYLSKIKDWDTKKFVRIEREAIVAPGMYPIYHHSHTRSRGGLAQYEIEDHGAAIEDKLKTDRRPVKKRPVKTVLTY